MTRREQFGAIHQTFNSVSWEDDRLDFIHYVGGRQPEIHEVCNFGDDGVTPKVHPFARVDIGASLKNVLGPITLLKKGVGCP